MGGYQVRLVRRRGLRQAFHLRIESAVPPHEAIFTSENYRDLAYARGLGRHFAERLGGSFLDES